MTLTYKIPGVEIIAETMDIYEENYNNLVLPKNEEKSFKKQSKDWKKEFVDNFEREKPNSPTDFSASTKVNYKGKTINIRFTKKFCRRWMNADSSMSPKRVVEDLHEKVLGIYLKSAYESNVSKFTIEGLGRPGTSTDRNHHAQKLPNGQYGPSYGMDIVSIKFGNKNAESMAQNQNRKGGTLSNDMTNLTKRLKANVQKYAPNSKAFLYEFANKRSYGLRPSNSPNGWRFTGQTPVGDSHKGHQHFSVKINPLDE